MEAEGRAAQERLTWLGSQLSHLLALGELLQLGVPIGTVTPPRGRPGSSEKDVAALDIQPNLVNATRASSRRIIKDPGGLGRPTWRLARGTAAAEGGVVGRVWRSEWRRFLLGTPSRCNGVMSSTGGYGAGPARGKRVIVQLGAEWGLGK